MRRYHYVKRIRVCDCGNMTGIPVAKFSKQLVIESGTVSDFAMTLEKSADEYQYENWLAPIPALSLCKGLKEVANALVLVCDECGNMTGIPAKSMLPIQQAAESLIDSELVSKIEDVTVELKSQVEKEKVRDHQSNSDYQDELHA